MRTLARCHALYLLLLAALPILVAKPLHGSALFFAFGPLAVFAALLAHGYRLTRKPLRALVLIGLVPLQVGLTTHFLGGSALDFFREESAVEVTGLFLGLFLVSAYRRPTGLVGALVVGALILSPWVALNWDFWSGLRTWPTWAQGACAFSLLSATCASAILFDTAAKAALQTGEAQDVHLVQGEPASEAEATPEEPQGEEDPNSSSEDAALEARTVGLELDWKESSAPLLGVGLWFAAFVARGAPIVWKEITRGL